MTDNTNTAATSGDAPDLQQLKALALAATSAQTVSEQGAALAEFSRVMALTSPAVVLDLIARIERNEVESYRRGYVEGMVEGARLAVEPATASGDELPPLPEPRAIRAGNSFPKVYARAYTADQLQEYARAAVSAATKPTADLSAGGLLKMWKQAEADATDTMPAPFQFARSLLATKPAGEQVGPDVDDLAQFIRTIDGNHSMGAGTLAEKIVEWLAPTAAPADQVRNAARYEYLVSQYPSNIADALDCGIREIGEEIDEAIEEDARRRAATQTTEGAGK